MYADDSTFGTSIDMEDDKQYILNRILEHAKAWFASNRLLLNENKTVMLTFQSKSNVSSKLSEFARNTRFLGVNIDRNLIWDDHINILCNKLAKSVFAIKKIKKSVNVQAATTTYYSLFHSQLTYGILAWGNAAHCHLQKVFILQKSAIRSIIGAKWDESCRPLFTSLKIMSLFSVIAFFNILTVKQNLDKYPTYAEVHQHDTRNKNNIVTPQNRLQISNNIGVRMINALPMTLRNLPLNAFKRRLKEILTENCLYSIEEFYQVVTENGNSFLVENTIP